MSFGLGLPATVAIFPQMAQIDAVDVEEKFQGLRNGQEDGLPYETYYFTRMWCTCTMSWRIKYTT